MVSIIGPSSLGSASASLLCSFSFCMGFPFCVGVVFARLDSFSHDFERFYEVVTNWERIDRPMDGQTDGQIDPLI